MKSVGERIRQARIARGLSGNELARRVGYKNQSAIGNLENRAAGTGGNKVGAIASALNVPVDWLINGPDMDLVPFAIGSIENSLEDWRLQASSKSQEVIDQLILLAKKNSLREEDWLLIEQMAQRFKKNSG